MWKAPTKIITQDLSQWVRESKNWKLKINNNNFKKGNQCPIWWLFKKIVFENKF